MFHPPMWLIGAGMSLESFRRGFIGGSMLSLFIIKEFGLDQQAAPTLDFLRGYLDVEEVVLQNIPPVISFITTPFTDYHNSAKRYLEIVDALALKQRPLACEAYW